MEVRIPFRQLRFPDGDELTFGLFMRRTVNRKNEIQNWPLVPLTYGSGYDSDLKTVSRYGRLTGLKNIRRGRNIEIKPYMITGAQSVRPDLTLAASMHARVGVAIALLVAGGAVLSRRIPVDPRARRWHPWLGASALVLAGVQIFLGLQLVRW